MKKREITSKEIRFANEKETQMILADAVAGIKKDSGKEIVVDGKNIRLPSTINSCNEEIQTYLDNKESLIYAVRLDLLFNTGESITLFHVFYLDKVDGENKCFDNEEDFIKDVNFFFDKRGNFYPLSYYLKYVDNKLTRLEDGYSLFKDLRN